MIYEFLVVCLLCANITPTYSFAERSSSAVLYCLKLQGNVGGGGGGGGGGVGLGNKSHFLVAACNDCDP